MNIARTAVLALAVLSVTAGRPASAQTFQERWSPIPRADAAEKPLLDQDQTLPRRSQQQVATPPDRSHSHSRMAQQQPPAPVTQQRAHPRGVMVGKASFCAYAVGTTASGTPYHRDKLTAASRILLFGTRLRVTDLRGDGYGSRAGIQAPPLLDWGSGRAFATTRARGGVRVFPTTRTRGGVRVFPTSRTRGGVRVFTTSRTRGGVRVFPRT
jgi:hypothetical protein